MCTSVAGGGRGKGDDAHMAGSAVTYGWHSWRNVYNVCWLHTLLAIVVFPLPITCVLAGASQDDEKAWR